MGSTWFGLFQKVNQSHDDVGGRNIVNSKITINGKTISNTTSNTVTIDGIEIKIEEINKSITIIVNGNVNNMSNGVGDIQINGDVSALTSSVGDVTIEGSVKGNVKNSTGDIRINGSVTGDVKTGVGDIKIKNNGIR